MHLGWWTLHLILQDKKFTVYIRNYRVCTVQDKKNGPTPNFGNDGMVQYFEELGGCPKLMELQKECRGNQH